MPPGVLLVILTPFSLQGLFATQKYSRLGNIFLNQNLYSKKCKQNVPGFSAAFNAAKNLGNFKLEAWFVLFSLNLS